MRCLIIRSLSSPEFAALMSSISASPPVSAQTVFPLPVTFLGLDHHAARVSHGPAVFTKVVGEVLHER